jgi:hypothetical protein
VGGGYENYLCLFSAAKMEFINSYYLVHTEKTSYMYMYVHVPRLWVLTPYLPRKIEYQRLVLHNVPLIVLVWKSL